MLLAQVAQGVHPAILHQGDGDRRSHYSPAPTRASGSGASISAPSSGSSTFGSSAASCTVLDVLGLGAWSIGWDVLPDLPAVGGGIVARCESVPDDHDLDDDETAAAA